MSTRRDPVSELLEIGGPPLSAVAAHIPSPLLDRAGLRGGELLRLLRSKNGFYAFESALHVIPAGGPSASTDLVEWNGGRLWRAEYGDLAENCLFFAEDVFGNQFCIEDGKMQLFDAETADREVVAEDLRGWAARILEEYETMTGYPLGHKWQSIYGSLESGRRLLPRIPFVAGGEYSVANLYAGDAVEGMRFRGNLARQIHSLPDGAKIQFKITP
jgi:hypothetical protein